MLIRNVQLILCYIQRENGKNQILVLYFSQEQADGCLFLHQLQLQRALDEVVRSYDEDLDIPDVKQMGWVWNATEVTHAVLKPSRGAQSDRWMDGRRMGQDNTTEAF
ncbi:uncharacterized protein LOC121404611 [Drosophila obscura]|uniref:uncharacterized protein LOC121404611 n=1 Tax=Drosophila obscura TaxID=7282 RepID=UPI001BB14BEA|nr:uncharacterized protein LOC121404611 [Drosophila obscura]